MVCPARASMSFEDRNNCVRGSVAVTASIEIVARTSPGVAAAKPLDRRDITMALERQQGLN